MKKTLIPGFVLASLLAAQAQSTIAQWNFNSNPSDANVATGLTTPSTGSGSLTVIGGATSTFATGSPGDPASSDNSGLNISTWAAQGTGSGTRGLQVGASTVGFDSITIALDFRQSGTVSRFFQLQLSSDGTTFVNASGGTASFGTVNNNTATSFDSTGLFSNNPGSGSQTFLQSITYTLSTGSIYADDPNFAFRWVEVFDPANGANYISANAGTTAAYATSGTGRFDMVSISGVAVPEPSTLALGGLGMAALFFSRRSRK